MRMRLIGLFLLPCMVIAAEPEPKLTDAERELFSKLISQAGHTQGYCLEYNIDEHEPAKSIIKLGARAIPELLEMIDDRRVTAVQWRGRSSSHNLVVGDVVTCILKHVGGASELRKLRQRQTWLKEMGDEITTWLHSNRRWSSEDRVRTFNIFDGMHVSTVVTMWSVTALEDRLLKECEK
jgi:hypothetical protein